MKARDQDIRLGLRHNVVGQETTGVGGFAKALRTIPVTLSICRDMKELCPDAWLINFTNPSGLVTEAVVKHGDGVRAIGLCNVPIGMQMWIAQALHIDPSRVRLDYVGLNHLSWVRHVHIGPLDLMGMAVDNVARIQAMIAERTDEKVFDPAVVKALRMFPSPYLRYYYNTQEMVAEEKNAPKNRAEVVMEIEAELLKLYQDPKLTTKPKELEKRGGAYYSVAAVNLMSSIFNSKGDVQIVNTRNGTCILDLPENVVVEVPCTIDRDGAHPLPVGHVEIAIRGLLQVVKAYEELAIEAAVSGDKRIAYQALLAHPLVGKAHLATVLLNELLEINRPYLPQFKR
jgi:6-phospho-beta-glucosidase